MYAANPWWHPKTLNKLLTEALDGSNELVPGSDHELVIVEARDGASRISDQASIPPLDESFTAYIAASVDEAAANHVAKASHFVVLDEQSSNDDTALLVSRNQDDGTVDGVARLTFDSVQAVLVSLAMATLGFAEVQGIADSQGGIYGKPTESPKRGEPAPRMKLGGN
ncbi:uncharacterized protein PG998_006680 [Apiospora kogelbergensis]|uniref:uncharacterized protein n=1 Tax=Apiospora kogelbergensis TaxID=1337665 RepID=UPI003132819E